MAQLTIRDESGMTTTHALVWSHVTIGRHPDNLICIEDVSVSSFHAEMTADDTQFLLHDLNSTNGTCVNRVRVDQIQLNNADAIRFGSVEAEFTSQPAVDGFKAGTVEVVPSPINPAGHIGKAVHSSSRSHRRTAILIVAGVALVFVLAVTLYHLSLVYRLGNYHQQGAAEPQTQPVVSRTQEQQPRSVPSIDGQSTRPAASTPASNSATNDQRESENVDAAVQAISKYVARSKHNSQVPVLGWDKPSGRMALFYAQYPQPPVTAEFLVGDLVPEETKIIPESKLGGYAVIFPTPKDTQLVAVTYPRASDGRLATRQQQNFVFWFDDRVDAEKTVHAMEFLCTYYAARGSKTAVPKLEGTALLTALLKRSRIQFKIEGDVLTFATQLDSQAQPHLSFSVHADDLDPDRFEWDKSGESRSGLVLGCREHVKAVDIWTNDSPARKIEHVALPIINEDTASRIAELIKNICVEHGWKATGF